MFQSLMEHERWRNRQLRLEQCEDRILLSVCPYSDSEDASAIVAAGLTEANPDLNLIISDSSEDAQHHELLSAPLPTTAITDWTLKGGVNFRTVSTDAEMADAIADVNGNTSGNFRITLGKDVTLQTDINARSGSLVIVCGPYKVAGASGITIRDTTFTDSTNAMLIHNTAGTLTVNNCVFRESSGSVETGGMAVSNTAGTVNFTDCSFINCTNTDMSTTAGCGAIWNTGVLTVDRCMFQNCSAAKDGGAIYNRKDLTIKDCTFEGCTVGAASGNGAAIQSYNSSATTLTLQGTNNFIRCVTNAVSSGNGGILNPGRNCTHIFDTDSGAVVLNFQYCKCTSAGISTIRWTAGGTTFEKTGTDKAVANITTTDVSNLFTNASVIAPYLNYGTPAAATDFSEFTGDFLVVGGDSTTTGSLSLADALAKVSESGSSYKKIYFADGAAAVQYLTSSVTLPADVEINADQKVSFNGTVWSTTSGTRTGSTTIDGLGKYNITVSAGNTAAIRGVSFRNGYSAANGGMICNNGTLTLTDCDFELCTAAGGGGAVYNSGTLTFAGSSNISLTKFDSCTAADGGAFYNATTGTMIFNCDSELGNCDTSTTGSGYRYFHNAAAAANLKSDAAGGTEMLIREDAYAENDHAGHDAAYGITLKYDADDFLTFKGDFVVVDTDSDTAGTHNITLERALRVLGKVNTNATVPGTVFKTIYFMPGATNFVVDSSLIFENHGTDPTQMFGASELQRFVLNGYNEAEFTDGAWKCSVNSNRTTVITCASDRVVSVKSGTYASLSNVTLQNDSGDGTGSGGALYVAGNLQASGTKIQNCRAANGGAIYVTGTGVLDYTDSLILENITATGNGGAIYTAAGSTSTFQGDLLITGSTSGGNGGAIYSQGTMNFGARVRTTSCTAAGNGGGAMFHGGTAVFQTFWAQHCEAVKGGGLYLDSAANITMRGTVGITQCHAAQTAGAFYMTGSSVLDLQKTSELKDITIDDSSDGYRFFYNDSTNIKNLKSTTSGGVLLNIYTKLHQQTDYPHNAHSAANGITILYNESELDRFTSDFIVVNAVETTASGYGITLAHALEHMGQLNPNAIEEGTYFTKIYFAESLYDQITHVANIVLPDSAHIGVPSGFSGQVSIDGTNVAKMEDGKWQLAGNTSDYSVQITAATDRTIIVDTDANVYLNALTLTNTADGYGGGLRIYGNAEVGNVTITDCHLTATGANGAGVLLESKGNLTVDGVLTLENCTSLSGNSFLYSNAESRAINDPNNNGVIYIKTPARTATDIGKDAARYDRKYGVTIRYDETSTDTAVRKDYERWATYTDDYIIVTIADAQKVDATDGEISLAEALMYLGWENVNSPDAVKDVFDKIYFMDGVNTVTLTADLAVDTRTADYDGISAGLVDGTYGWTYDGAAWTQNAAARTGGVTLDANTAYRVKVGGSIDFNSITVANATMNGAFLVQTIGELNLGNVTITGSSSSGNAVIDCFGTLRDSARMDGVVISGTRLNIARGTADLKTRALYIEADGSAYLGNTTIDGTRQLGTSGASGKGAGIFVLGSLYITPDNGTEDGVNGVIVQNCNAALYGGGIYVGDDTAGSSYGKILTIQGGGLLTVQGNHASYGGGIFTADDGYVSVASTEDGDERNGELVVQNNSAAYSGGGIADITEAEDKYYNTKVIGNTAEIAGAGVAVLISATGSTVGKMFICDSLIQGNVSGSSASSGGNWKGTAGGVYNEGTLTLKDTAVAENTAVSFAGGLYSCGTLTLQGDIYVFENISTKARAGGVYISTLIGGGMVKTENMSSVNSYAYFTDARVYIGGNQALGTSGTQVGHGGGLYYATNYYETRNAGCVLELTDTLLDLGSYTEAATTNAYLNAAYASKLLDGKFNVAGNKAAGNGGGYYAENSLVLNGTSTLNVRNNTARRGGGMFLDRNGGFTYENPNTVQITVEGNSVTNNGGGIFSLCTLDLRNVRVLGNTATVAGGGIYNAALMTIRGNSEISGNVANSQTTGNITLGGGGVYNAAQLELYDTVLISGNTANAGNGGGIYNTYYVNDNTTLNRVGLTKFMLNSNVTFRDNTAAEGVLNSKYVGGMGGGMYVASTNAADTTQRSAVYVYAPVLFEENTARYGGGMYLDSLMSINQNGKQRDEEKMLQFTGNNKDTAKLAAATADTKLSEYANYGAGLYLGNSKKVNLGKVDGYVTITDGSWFGFTDNGCIVGTDGTYGGAIYNASSTLTFKDSFYSFGDTNRGVEGAFLYSKGSVNVSAYQLHNYYAGSASEDGNAVKESYKTFTMRISGQKGGSVLAFETNNKTSELENIRLYNNDADGILVKSGLVTLTDASEIGSDIGVTYKNYTDDKNFNRGNTGTGVRVQGGIFNVPATDGTFYALYKNVEGSLSDYQVAPATVISGNGSYAVEITDGTAYMNEVRMEGNVHGVKIDSADAYFSQVLISDWTADEAGVQITGTSADTVEFRNSTIVNDRRKTGAVLTDGNVGGTNKAMVRLYNTIAVDTLASLSSTVTSGIWTNQAASGSLYEDFVFKKDVLGNKYTVGSTSVALNSGINADALYYAYVISENGARERVLHRDIAGHDRIMYNTVDIGAFEQPILFQTLQELTHEYSYLNTKITVGWLDDVKYYTEQVVDASMGGRVVFDESCNGAIFLWYTHYDQDVSKFNFEIYDIAPPKVIYFDEGVTGVLYSDAVRKAMQKGCVNANDFHYDEMGVLVNNAGDKFDDLYPGCTPIYFDVWFETAYTKNADNTVTVNINTGKPINLTQPHYVREAIQVTHDTFIDGRYNCADTTINESSQVQVGDSVYYYWMDITLDAQGDTQLFHVMTDEALGTNTNFTMYGLTLAHGVAVVSDEDPSSGYGGAIYAEGLQDTVVIMNLSSVSIENCTAELEGGGIYCNANAVVQILTPELNGTAIGRKQEEDGKWVIEYVNYSARYAISYFEFNSAPKGGAIASFGGAVQVGNTWYPDAIIVRGVDLTDLTYVIFLDIDQKATKDAKGNTLVDSNGDPIHGWDLRGQGTMYSGAIPDQDLTWTSADGKIELPLYTSTGSTGAMLGYSVQFVSNGTDAGHATQQGGAFYLKGNSIVEYASFVNNFAMQGGAIYFEDMVPGSNNSCTLSNTDFLANVAYCGGAIYLSSGTVAGDGNVVFAKNVAGKRIRVTGGIKYLTEEGDNGGAIYVQNPDEAVVVNLTEGHYTSTERILFGTMAESYVMPEQEDPDPQTVPVDNVESNTLVTTVVDNLVGTPYRMNAQVTTHSTTAKVTLRNASATETELKKTIVLEREMITELLDRTEVFREVVQTQGTDVNPDPNPVAVTFMWDGYKIEDGLLISTVITYEAYGTEFLKTTTITTAVNRTKVRAAINKAENAGLKGRIQNALKAKYEKIYDTQPSTDIVINGITYANVLTVTAAANGTWQGTINTASTAYTDPDFLMASVDSTPRETCFIDNTVTASRDPESGVETRVTTAMEYIITAEYIQGEDPTITVKMAKYEHMMVITPTLSLTAAEAGESYVFLNNQAWNGGAVDFAELNAESTTINKSLTLENAVVRDNTALNDGGGITMKLANYYFTDVSIDSNEAAHNGGGLMLVDIMENASKQCAANGLYVTNNTAGNNGGGIYIGNSGLIVNGTQLQTVLNIHEGHQFRVGITETGEEGGNSAKNGGGIYLESGAAVNNYGTARVAFNEAVATVVKDVYISDGCGGGVYIGGTWNNVMPFLESDQVDAIYANTAYYGGGCYAASNSFFTVGSDTAVAMNCAKYGGGMYMDTAAKFTINAECTLKLYYNNTDYTYVGEDGYTVDVKFSEKNIGTNFGGGIAVCKDVILEMKTVSLGTVAGTNLYLSGVADISYNGTLGLTYGGGMMLASDANATLRSPKYNNIDVANDAFIFSYNNALYGGGISVGAGLYATSSLTIADDIVLRGNNAVYGGGMCVSGTLNIDAGYGLTFRNNNTSAALNDITNYGGGLYVFSGATYQFSSYFNGTKYVGSRFVGNGNLRSTSGGAVAVGGMSDDSCGRFVVNAVSTGTSQNVIEENNAMFGGAFYLNGGNVEIASGASLTLQNNNSYHGGGIGIAAYNNNGVYHTGKVTYGSTTSKLNVYGNNQKAAFNTVADAAWKPEMDALRETLRAEGKSDTEITEAVTAAMQKFYYNIGGAIYIAPNAVLDMKNPTLVSFELLKNNQYITNGSEEYTFGGVFALYGKLILNGNLTIQHQKAYAGGVIYLAGDFEVADNAKIVLKNNKAKFGGTFYHAATYKTYKLGTGATILNDSNTATYGGVNYIETGATFYFDNTNNMKATYTNNTAVYGGVVYNAGTVIAVKDADGTGSIFDGASNVSGNTARYGSMIYSIGTLTLNGTTFMNEKNPDAFGTITIGAGTATLNDCAVHDNMTTDGIYVYDAKAVNQIEIPYGVTIDSLNPDHQPVIVTLNDFTAPKLTVNDSSVYDNKHTNIAIKKGASAEINRSEIFSTKSGVTTAALLVANTTEAITGGAWLENGAKGPTPTASAVVNDSYIYDNDIGISVAFDGSSVIVNNTRMYDNAQGIRTRDVDAADGCTVGVYNSVIRDWTSSGAGKAISISNGTCNIVNCTIASFTDRSSSGIAVTENGTITLANSLVPFTSLTSDITAAVGSKNGLESFDTYNFNSTVDEVTHDRYLLTQNSTAAIDQGLYAQSLYSDGTQIPMDVRSQTRKLGNEVDLGAYESDFNTLDLVTENGGTITHESCVHQDGPKITFGGVKVTNNGPLKADTYVVTYTLKDASGNVVKDKNGEDVKIIQNSSTVLEQGQSTTMADVEFNLHNTTLAVGTKYYITWEVTTEAQDRDPTNNKARCLVPIEVLDVPDVVSAEINGTVNVTIETEANTTGYLVLYRDKTTDPLEKWHEDAVVQVVDGKYIGSFSVAEGKKYYNYEVEVHAIGTLGAVTYDPEKPGTTFYLDSAITDNPNNVFVLEPDLSADNFGTIEVEWKYNADGVTGEYYVSVNDVAIRNAYLMALPADTTFTVEYFTTKDGNIAGAHTVGSEIITLTELLREGVQITNCLIGGTPATRVHITRALSSLPKIPEPYVYYGALQITALDGETNLTNNDAHTLMQIILPNAPTNVQQNSVEISFPEEAVIDGAASYAVEYSTDPAAFQDPAKADLVSRTAFGTSKTITVNGLTENTQYFFRVVARTAAGTDVNLASVPVSAKTIGGTVDLATNDTGTLRQSPGNVTISRMYVQNIGTKDCTDGKIAFKMEYYDTTSSSWVEVSSAAATYGLPTLKIGQSLPETVTYSFATTDAVLKNLNRDVQMRLSWTVSSEGETVLTNNTGSQQFLILATPTLTATAWSSTEIKVNITSASGDNVTNFVVEYSTDPTFATGKKTVYGCQRGDNIITGLSQGVTYHFRTYAVYSENGVASNSDYSNTASATTPRLKVDLAALPGSSVQSRIVHENGNIVVQNLGTKNLGTETSSVYTLQVYTYNEYGKEIILYTDNTRPGLAPGATATVDSLSLSTEKLILGQNYTLYFRVQCAEDTDYTNNTQKIGEISYRKEAGNVIYAVDGIGWLDNVKSAVEYACKYDMDVVFDISCEGATFVWYNWTDPETGRKNSEMYDNPIPENIYVLDGSDPQHPLRNIWLTSLGRTNDSLVINSTKVEGITLDAQGSCTLFQSLGDTNLNVSMYYLTLKNGQKTDTSNGGGGICLSNNVTLNLYNVSFENCHAETGGAIYACKTAYVNIVTNKGMTFKYESTKTSLYRGNTAVNGGAIAIMNTRANALTINGGSGTVAFDPTTKALLGYNVQFAGNSASKYGGAIYTLGDAAVTCASFVGNSSTYNGLYSGGAMFVGGSASVTLTSCDFLSNSSLTAGGALAVCGEVNGAGVIFAGNWIEGDGGLGGSSGLGGAIYVYQNASVNFSSTTVSTRTKQLYTNGASSRGAYGSEFLYNEAYDGGAVFFDRCGACTLSNAYFGFNQATDGGAIYAKESAPVLDVTYESNYAYRYASDYWQNGKIVGDTSNLVSDSLTGRTGILQPKIVTNATQVVEIEDRPVTAAAPVQSMTSWDNFVLSIGADNASTTVEAGGAYLTSVWYNESLYRLDEKSIRPADGLTVELVSMERSDEFAGWVTATFLVKADETFVGNHYATMVFTPTGNAATDGTSSLFGVEITNFTYDLNDDGAVNVADLILFAKQFGKSGTSSESLGADFNGDGNVNITDLIMFAKQFGKKRSQTTLEGEAAAVLSEAPAEALAEALTVTESAEIHETRNIPEPKETPEPVKTSNPEEILSPEETSNPAKPAASAPTVAKIQEKTDNLKNGLNSEWKLPETAFEAELQELSQEVFAYDPAVLLTEMEADTDSAVNFQETGVPEAEAPLFGLIPEQIQTSAVDALFEEDSDWNLEDVFPGNAKLKNK